MSQATLTNREKFFLFCLVLFAIGLMLIGMSWNANSLFSSAYQPVVEKSKRLHKAEAEQNGEKSLAGDAENEDEKPSAQPRAAGMREQDIDKTEGDGYRTY